MSRWRQVVLFVLCGILVSLTGCETMPEDSAARTAMNQAILSEPAGNYFIGRRMHKRDYKMWGWIRQPGKPWKTARLVMLNEQKTLAPDRVAGSLGSDNNTEYKLFGSFTGDRIYEPASDTIYPEFFLSGAEVISRTPPRIFGTKRQEDPAVRILLPPI